jgi:hypothetical protein
MYIAENTLKPLSLQKTMSTTNVQNLLSNVFHPIFVYDATNRVYKSKLELVNIDTISANTVSTYFASVGDSNSNVYVGIGSGNPNSILVSSSNVNNTFVGAGAGARSSNVSNAVFIGYNAGQNSVNSSNTIAIGSNADGDGSNNIYIGAGTGLMGVAGLSNIFIGQGIAPAGLFTKQFLLGPLVSQPPSSLTNSLAPNYLLGGDFASNRLGINLSNPTYNLDVNGYARIGTNSVGGLGINTNPLDYTLNVNGDMQVSDGYGVLRFSHDVAGVSRTSIAGIVNEGGSPAAVGVATLQVSDGFFSASGTITVADGTGSNIGVWKKGVTLVSLQDATCSHYAAQMNQVLVSNTTYILSPLSSNSSSGTGIFRTSSNIVVSNTTGGSLTYVYSITYFASP